MSDVNLDELFEALQPDFGLPEKKEGLSAREERIIAGFEDIKRFAAEHGRLPQDDADRDIFERLYARRLQALRQSAECRAVLQDWDAESLLDGGCPTADEYEISDDELLAELQSGGGTDDITRLTNVRPAREREALKPDYVAQYRTCADFEQFAPLFAQIKAGIQTGAYRTEAFSGSEMAVGDFFILNGQTVYIAAIGEKTKNPNGTFNARMQVIVDNGTESDLLNRSLERALYKDKSGRRIVPAAPQTQPSLFGSEAEEGDIESGTIYVLRSLSDHPTVAAHRELIHKIGVTGGKVAARIAHAEHDATYLLAKVEVVAEYKLSNINRGKLEKILHKLFAPAQLDITIQDRFGNPVQPKEWFLLPLNVIDQAVQAIIDGTVTQLAYDPETARLE